MGSNTFVWCNFGYVLNMTNIKKILHQNKIDRPEHIAYNVHWAIMLTVLSIVILGVLFGGVYVYRGVAEGTLIKDVEQSNDLNLELINEDQLEEVTDGIVRMEEQFLKIKRSVPVGDPAR